MFKNSVIRVLTNPMTSILAMVLGGLIGFANNELGVKLSVYGEMYQLLLKMTVIPILVSAVITSLGRFVSDYSMKKMLGKIVFALVLFSFIYSIVGIGIGYIFRPGDLSEEDRSIVSEQISLQSEVFNMELETIVEESSQQKEIIDFLLFVIPANIFEALSENHILAILVFSILFGLALGAVPKKKGQKIQSFVIIFFLEIYSVFSNMVKYIIMVLPFALICIVSSEIANSGVSLVLSSGKLIAIFYIFGTLLMIINTIFLSMGTKVGFFGVTKYMLYPSLVAFTTRNSIASMSIAIDVLKDKFKFNHKYVQSTMPLLMVLGRFGNIFYFALVSMFAIQLYYVQLSAGMIVFLCIAVVLAGLATSGANGFATLGVLSIVMEPIGVPFETILVILLIIDTIVDPLRTTLIVHTNTIISALLHRFFIKETETKIGESS